MSGTATTAGAKPLRVVVCENHNEVIEHIHGAIRRRALGRAGVALVHIDAHPDLAVPRSFVASKVYDPAALYDFLEDSPGGIAEWVSAWFGCVGGLGGWVSELGGAASSLC